MKAALMFAALVFLTPIFSAPADCQSLGDVARNRQTRTTKAKRVITEDDIPASPQASYSAESENTSTSPDQENVTLGDAKKTDVSAPQSDREKISGLKAKLSDLNSKEREYHINIAQLEKKLQAADTDFRAEMYRDALENNRHSLKVVTEQREQAEKQLSEMQQKVSSTGSKAASN